MSYIIKIEHVENKEKAGKLRLTSESGEVLIKSEAIGLPQDLVSDINQIVELKIKKYINNKLYINDEQYFRAFKKLENINLNETLEFGNYLFIKNTKNIKELTSVEDAFVVSPDTYLKLSSLSADENIKLEVNKVKFLFFPKNINTKNKNVKVKTLLHNFSIFEKQAHNNLTLSLIKKKSQSDLNFATIPINTKKVSFKGTSTDNNVSYETANTLEFNQPTSILSWVTYFNQNEIDSKILQENINQVKGFENVAKTEIFFTPSGYSVNLYEDEEKSKKIGNVQYDGKTDLYELKSNDGKQINLTMEKDGSSKYSTDGKEYVEVEPKLSNLDSKSSENDKYEVPAQAPTTSKESAYESPSYQESSSSSYSSDSSNSSSSDSGSSYSSPD